MTARRDPDRLLRSLLEDGPTELPDRSYDAVRSAIDQTRQRVVFGPWREPQLSKSIPFAIAAAAVLVVAVVGFNLMPRQSQVGSAGPTATLAPMPTAAAAPTAAATRAPRPTSSPRATASPTETEVALPMDGEVAAGRYFRYEGPLAEPTIRVEFTMPAGWATAEGSFLYKERGQPGEVMFVTWLVTHVFRDVCQWGSTGPLVDAGTTVDELVAALADQQGREASAPTETTLGGFPATRIDLTVPADVETSTCTNGNLRYWPDPGPNLSGGLCCNRPGNTDAVYVVDAYGERLVVVVRHYPDSSAENRAELQAIVDSIEIEPAGD